MNRIWIWALIIITLILIVDGVLNLLGIFVWHPVEWLSLLEVVLGIILLGIALVLLWRDRKAYCPTNPTIKRSDPECD